MVIMGLDGGKMLVDLLVASDFFFLLILQSHFLKVFHLLFDILGSFQLFQPNSSIKSEF